MDENGRTQSEPGMLQRVRAYDWGATALGPIERWSQALRTAVDITLSSNLPMVMAWGPDAQLIYNDGYAVFAGARHPYLLGLNVRAAWPEVADFNQHVLDTTLAGNPLSYKDQPMVLFRNGHPEDVWLDLDYIPLRDTDGVPRGFLAVVVETTARVNAERAYHRAREQVELALDAGAVIGTWLWDVQANRVTGDHRFAHAFSLDPAQAAAGCPSRPSWNASIRATCRRWKCASTRASTRARPTVTSTASASRMTATCGSRPPDAASTTRKAAPPASPA